MEAAQISVSIKKNTKRVVHYFSEWRNEKRSNEIKRQRD